MRRNRRGFTLVEIIVVLVILAILTAIVVPTALGYVDDAKEAWELAKLRESLIAAQVTFVKSAAFGEIGNDVNNETGSKNYYLTDNQSESIQKYLDTKPYVLIYGIGAPSYYGGTSKEASNVYCIIYQKDKDSKRWYYDGKKWSHRYLWNKDSAKPGEDATRAMYTKDEYNRMRNVKDSKNEDARVTMCYGYAYGNLCQNGGSYSEIWNVIKKLSE